MLSAWSNKCKPKYGAGKYKLRAKVGKCKLERVVLSTNWRPGAVIKNWGGGLGSDPVAEKQKYP